MAVEVLSRADIEPVPVPRALHDAVADRCAVEGPEAVGADRAERDALTVDVDGAVAPIAALGQPVLALGHHPDVFVVEAGVQLSVRASDPLAAVRRHAGNEEVDDDVDSASSTSNACVQISVPAPDPSSVLVIQRRHSRSRVSSSTIDPPSRRPTSARQPHGPASRQSIDENVERCSQGRCSQSRAFS